MRQTAHSYGLEKAERKAHRALTVGFATMWGLVYSSLLWYFSILKLLLTKNLPKFEKSSN